MEERGYHTPEDFIGQSLENVVPTEELDRDFKIVPQIDEGNAWVVDDAIFLILTEGIKRWIGTRKIESLKSMIGNAWDAICASTFFRL